MPQALIPVETALTRLLDGLTTIAGIERVDLLRSVGRVLAEDLTAQVNVPTQDNSAMDGFALRADDLRVIPMQMPVSQRIPAGIVGDALQPNTAARIFTGAPIPSGANAVVLQENCDYSDSEVTIRQAVIGGENIRRQGEDVKLGAMLCRAGHRIRIQDINLLAAAGIQSPAIFKSLRVAVLTTGDELLRPGAAMQAGKIYNSNFFQLAALLNALGMQVIDCGITADNSAATEQAITRAASKADVIISSGGVSVGDEDHVRVAIQKLGTLKLWKLAMKPGKPFAFGAVAEKPFFGLPGNPVSAFVTFVILVRPALLKLCGASDVTPRYFSVPVAANIPDSLDRQEYLRVSLRADASGSLALFPYNSQSSGVSASLSMTDGLAVVPPFSSIKKGDLLRFLPFSELVN